MKTIPQKSPFTPAEHLLITLVMGLMGMYFWAIRGTGGYGGAQGAVVAGLGWALLWQLFSSVGAARAGTPPRSPWILAAIILGVGFGGMTGYGVYTAWVRGEFFLNYPDGMRPVAPWTGYAMLFVCGLHWGGIAGAFIAWALADPVSRKTWGLRIVSGWVGAFLAVLFVSRFPQLFLPFHGEGLYLDPANKTCIRAAGSMENVFWHVGLFLGFVVCELARGNRRGAALMLLVALGFALPFAVGGYWHTLREAPLRLDWWKNWEMSIGLGGGLTLGGTFWAVHREPAPARTRSDVPRFVLVLLGLALFIALRGAWKGVAGHEQLDVKALAGGLVFAALMLGALGVFLHRAAGKYREGFLSQLPAWALLAGLGVICLCGYAVTLPGGPSTGRSFLLAVYTGDVLAGGLILLGVLHGGRGAPLQSD